MTAETNVRQVTFFGMDLDRYRITQFEGVQAGRAVAGWELVLGDNNDFLGFLDDSMPSGRAVNVAKNVDDDLSLWIWDQFGESENASVLGLVRSLSDTISIGVIVRASETGGYSLVIDGTNLTILKNESTLATMGFPAVKEENLWLRLEVITINGGVLIRSKVWRGEMSDEPLLWMLSADDLSSPILGPGSVGLATLLAGASYLCGMFRARSLIGSAIETLIYSTPTGGVSSKDIPASTPNLRGVSFSPTTINPGRDMGKRGSWTLVFDDHPHADSGELYKSGTYWGKFRGRQIFRRGQPCFLSRVVIDDFLEDIDDREEVRHAVLESFSGPARDGTFTIIAQDALKLADNDRAQCPIMSNGFLLSDIDEVTTSATLTPTGIGDLEYPTTGYVAIGGSEVCGFTRSGDSLTLLRGQFETEPVSHSTEDRVQLCAHFLSANAATIAETLLVVFAEVEPSMIPSADWQLEVETYLPFLYSRLIAEPTGVNQLLSELIEQAGLVMWHDDIANQVRLQVLRTVPATAFNYDETNTLAGSIQPQEQPSLRINEVWTYFGMRNPLVSSTEPTNYRSSLATIDFEAEALFGDAVIRKMFATWSPAFARNVVERVNNLQIGRYSRPPRRITFDVARYSLIPTPELGAGYHISWRGNQDEMGGQISSPIQVVRVNPLADRIQVEAEEMFFIQFDPEDLSDRVITIDSNFNNVFLRILHDTIFPAPTDQDVIDGVTLTVIIAGTAIIGSNDPGAFAFDVGTPSDWPVGFSITVQVEAGARIQGRGGKGGYLVTGGGGTFAPDPGSPAFRTRFPVTINNSGKIWGGGGGGGFGASPGAGGMGGGGAGVPPGAGGPVFTGGVSPGAAGTPDVGGAGGVGSDGTTHGGDGGGPGQPGNSGVGSAAAQPGAAAGTAIDGVSFVTFAATGDIRGPQIN